MYKKGRPVVQDNGYGGAISILPDGVKINIVQKDIEGQGTMLIEVRKEAEIVNSIENLIVVEAGDCLSGDIREMMSMSPPDPDDELLFLSWLPDGSIERIDGKVVYRWAEYYQEPMDGE